MLTSLFRGVRLIVLIWIVLLILAIALGFIHQAHRHGAHPASIRQSQFEGTTDALKRMRIPEILAKEPYPGFRADQQKQQQERKTK